MKPISITHRTNPLWQIRLLIGFGAFILFVPFLGGVHLFDWDEINFAECAREMIVLNDFQQVSIDYQPFWEKPPLFIWMQAAGMQIFGVGEFAARLPNAICGIISLLLLFELGRKYKSIRLGAYWTLAYAGSLLPHFYFRSGIIDPWFNLFIFLSFWFLYRSVQLRENSQPRMQVFTSIAIAGVCNGLACLTKGQVAWLVVMLCLGVLWVLYRFRFYITIFDLLLFTLLSWGTMFLWFAIDYVENGPQLLIDFYAYQYRLFSTPDAGHAGFPGFHFVIVLLGCFPASFVALGLIPKRISFHLKTVSWVHWCVVMLFVVLILFSIVQSKIIHYSSLAYFPLTFLAAWAMDSQTMLHRWQRLFLRTLSVVFAFVVLAFPLLVRYRSYFLSSIQDVFVKGNLEVPVSWSGFEGLPILLLLVGTWMGLRYMLKGQKVIAWTMIYSGSGLALALLFYTLLPKIEPHTQGSAVAFFKALQGKNCYVHCLGYKSYAHLFYAQPVVPTQSEYYSDQQTHWLLHGPIERDAYFCTKVNKAIEYMNDENRKDGLQKIGEGGGFVFFHRPAVPSLSQP